MRDGRAEGSSATGDEGKLHNLQRMHAHDNGCPTHEVTYVIGHANTRLHL